MTRWLYYSLSLTLVALAVPLYLYWFQFDSMPEKMPIHWNIEGKPDGWVDRENIIYSFMISPGIMVLMVVLTVALPWLSPRQFDIESFRRTYDYVMALIVTLMGFIEALIIWGSLHPEESTIRVLVAGMLLFFALIGNVMGQMRRNFYMGIRTPGRLPAKWFGIVRTEWPHGSGQGTE